MAVLASTACVKRAQGDSSSDSGPAATSSTGTPDSTGEGETGSTGSETTAGLLTPEEWTAHCTALAEEEACNEARAEELVGEPQGGRCYWIRWVVLEDPLTCALGESPPGYCATRVITGEGEGTSYDCEERFVCYKHEDGVDWIGASASSVCEGEFLCRGTDSEGCDCGCDPDFPG